MATASYSDVGQTAAKDDAEKTTIMPVQSTAQGEAEIMKRLPDNVAANLQVAEYAIEAVGFGKVQWQLALSCGFGFLADQVLLVSVSLVGPQTIPEFAPKYPTLLAVPLYAGLLAGAVILGVLADNIGRRLVWQVSIFGISIVAMISASAPNWAVLNFFVMLCGFFGGGNLAIDLTILAESIPSNWTWVLCGLASIWGLGNTVAGLVAWALIVPFSCPPEATPEICPRSANMGWRYLYITLGGMCLVMALVRAFIMRTYESPKWLVSCGRYHEAVDVINQMSAANKLDFRISIDQFDQAARTETSEKSWRENLRRAAMLFSGKKQLRLMGCLTIMWMLIGIAYPLYTIFLPYYLRANGANFGDTSNYTTYRDWAVSSVVGIFGPVLSMWMVSNKWLLSRRSMIITGVCCAAFSAAFTTVRNAGQNLGFSCMINFWLNALYAIIYAYTPQSLSVENRGLGNGLLMATGRAASLTAPFIATFADVTTSAPIWVSCACYIIIGAVGLVLPVDTVPFKQALRS